MSQAGTPQTAAPPADPIRAALDDPEVQSHLRLQALAVLGRLLADRPQSVRNDTAADALQEMNRRAWEQRTAFNPALEQPAAAWLHGILVRVLHEHCRTLRKQPAQPDAHPEAWDAVAARMSNAEAIAGLLSFLPQLTEDRRRIITMHHLDEMSHEQIAAQLGIGVGSSRVRLARAMTELKRLAAEGGDQ